MICKLKSCKRRAGLNGICKTHDTQRRDREFSIHIRERDGACRKCLSQERLQCAHIVSRRYRNIRWDDENAVALCQGCHVYFTHRPLEWEEFIDGLFGAETTWSLKRRALA